MSIELPPSLAAQPVSVAFGARREDKNWAPFDITFGNLIKRLSKFRRGEKNGAALTQGKLIAPQRLTNNVVCNYLMMIDCDTGESLDEIAAKLQAADVAALLWTTYSHLKPYTHVAETKLVTWAKKQKLSVDDGHILETVKCFLATTGKVKQSIIDSITGVEKEMAEGGVRYIVHHDPMPRVRVLMLLSEPFDFTKGGTQKERIAEWKAKYAAVCDQLELAYDHVCIDPARLMYLPVIAPDADETQHEIRWIDGGLLDLSAVADQQQREDDPLAAFSQNGQRPTALARSGTLHLKTPGLAKFLKEHGSEFNAAEFLRTVAIDDIRSDKGDKVECMCPNDDAHSDAGNPEDRAFFATDAISGEGWTMHCMHDSCTQESSAHSHDGRPDRAWFLDRCCEKYGIEDAKDLIPYTLSYDPAAAAFLAAEAAEAAAEAVTLLTIARDKIDALTPDTTGEEIDDLVRVLAAQPVSIVVEDLIKKVADRTGRSIGPVRDAVRAARRALETAAPAEDGDNTVTGGPIRHPVPSDPGSASTIWMDWGHPDQCECAAARFSKKNAEKPAIFVRPEGGRVRLEKTKRGYTLKEFPNDQSSWQYELTSRKIEFKTTTDDGREESVPPFSNVLSYLVGNHQIDLPVIERVTRVPVFSKDGKLQTTKGYNEDNEVFLDPNMNYYTVSEKPTDEELARALDCLGEALRDFPFTDCFEGADPLPVRRSNDKGEFLDLDEDGFPLPNFERGRSSRAHAISMILQPFVRNMIDGPCPNYHIDKPERGTGAGYLVDCAWWIFEGGRAEVQTMDATREEIKKAITTTLREGASILFLDNIEQKVDSPDIAAALTAGTWKARILGVSENVIIPIRATWIMAGNRVPFSQDMMRRNVPIFMDAATANPAQDRKGNFYKHHPFHSWLKENRRILVWSCHTIIQSWISAGCPAGKAEMQSFSEWASVMGGILNHAGIDGFLDVIKDYIGTRSEDQDAVQAVTTRVWTKFGTNKTPLKDIYEALCVGGQGGFSSMMARQSIDPALGITLNGRDDAGQIKSLGQVLTREYLGKTIRLDDGVLVSWVKRKEATGVAYQIMKVS